MNRPMNIEQATLLETLDKSLFVPCFIPTSPTSWRSILILSTHLRLGLPSGLFPSGGETGGKETTGET